MSEIFDWQKVAEERQARIAALELALKGIVLKPGQILEVSKLGELFQALLEEHKVFDVNKGAWSLEYWKEVESLRKEVGL